MNLNTKLFISTFILIFLAELGDKTQLAAMAKSIEGRMTVFLAASAALVCSTLIAVLCGDTLTRFIPERYLQVGAALLFLVFGILMLYKVFVVREAEAQAAPVHGTFARFIAHTAITFEEAAQEDYRQLACTMDNEAMRRVLLALADEEKDHIQKIRETYQAHKGQEAFADTSKEALPELEQLLHNVSEDQARPFINHAIEHELATAAFYDTLARNAKLPALKRTLKALAQAEQHHADILRGLG
jgi:rubrerythrin